ncbi:hypothetical protein B0H19DRAFT_1262618 [Mycena capillaripes]|nr:hypothetical protein B0H19DRAFT_1377193 [Mycena capillaripes]KAJ6554230.1 hypothetical protein B0H19DRAFT_1262618 [Mycena capillaripes]
MSPSLCTAPYYKTTSSPAIPRCPPADLKAMQQRIRELEILLDPPLPHFNWDGIYKSQWLENLSMSTTRLKRHSRMFPGRQAIARRVYHQSPGEPLQFSFPSSFPHAPRSSPEPLPDQRFGRRTSARSPQILAVHDKEAEDEGEEDDARIVTTEGKR